MGMNVATHLLNVEMFSPAIVVRIVLLREKKAVAIISHYFTLRLSIYFIWHNNNHSNELKLR